MYRIRVCLQGAGDHFFLSEASYPGEGPANASEFAEYIRQNYPDASVEVVPEAPWA